MCKHVQEHLNRSKTKGMAFWTRWEPLRIFDDKPNASNSKSKFNKFSSYLTWGFALVWVRYVGLFQELYPVQFSRVWVSIADILSKASYEIHIIITFPVGKMGIFNVYVIIILGNFFTLKYLIHVKASPQQRWLGKGRFIFSYVPMTRVEASQSEKWVYLMG
jgi:hypothetical protein